MMSLPESVSPTARAILARAQTPERIRQLLFQELGMSSARLLGMDDKVSHDEKLRNLTIALGLLAGATGSNSLLKRDLLKRIGAHCVGWIESFKLPKQDDVFAFVEQERVRQTRLFHAGDFLFNVASPVVDERRKLRVLVEEFSEVAEAIDECERAQFKRRYARVKTWTLHLASELTQVAAVCVAWMEALESEAR